VFATGMGLQFVSLTLMALSNVPDRESGAASGPTPSTSAPVPATTSPPPRRAQHSVLGRPSRPCPVSCFVPELLFPEESGVVEHLPRFQRPA
ncbi:hypothetical protein, partial [Streptomyces sp. NPDC048551]|uniref:hypothetical protein n=1 Tax=Streptomyces sp. NPDC048551 TaxID=3155758 RepID=UPI003439EBA0